MSPEFWVFVGKLLPTIIGLAQQLFTRFAGDAEAAEAEIARIYPRGDKLTTTEAQLDEQLDELERK